MSTHAETDRVVFILDRAGPTRDALTRLLLEAGWRVRTCEAAEEFLRAPQAAVPTCLVLNAVLDDCCGLELQRVLADCRPHLQLVFFAASAEVAAGVRAMKAGAVDFLALPLDERELSAAVDEAIRRSGAALARDAELRMLGKSYASLSGREREVMALVTSGLLNKQAGGRLGISEITVKAHRGQVMRKMNARSFAELVNKANRLGLEAAPYRESRPFAFGG